MKKNFISRSLLVTFILAMAVIPLLMLFLQTKEKNSNVGSQRENQLLVKIQQNLLSETPTPTLTPVPKDFLALIKKEKTIAVPTIAAKITPQPTILTAVMQAQDVSNWTTYKNSTEIGSSFSFTYPSGWKVSYKKDATQTNSYQFQFTQGKQSQIMTVVLSAAALSAQDFIDTNYPQKLTYETFGTIGSSDNTLYRLNLKDTVPASDPLSTTFGSRGLVVGKQHSYMISFDSTADHTMIDAIEKTIWPNFTFK